MKKRKSSKPFIPTCVFCGRSSGAQFAIFNPRFQPFGTACTDCEATLPPGTVLPPVAARTNQPDAPADLGKV